MPSLSVPPHLIQYVGAPSTSHWQAAEALEEWVWQRRAKGDSLFEVAVGLLDLEDRVRHRTPAFDRARYLTNIPPPTDLTPPDNDSARASTSPVTILHHILSTPSTVERSREVILEYALAREGKLRDKRPGRGGKGTLGREGLEDVGERLGEVEDGLRGRPPSGEGMTGGFVSGGGFELLGSERDGELDETRQAGLALILSVRMSLSYFTLQALAGQLMVLAVPVAERVLVQHIRRRVEGEGRYGVGVELETLQDLGRPALRPAFRSARFKMSLPEQPLAVPLPAPSKSNVIKLITAHIKESPPSPPDAPSEQGSNGSSAATAAYVLELVTEYLTRERREYMLKCKWAVKGRDALSRDLGDIESSTCLVKGAPTPSAPHLIPVFLVLRRSFLLPPTPMPPAVVEPYYDILPAPPDPDEEFRAPSVSSTTASLYVNPRLEDEAARAVLEELVETERENAAAAGLEVEEVEEVIADLVEQVEKRFPDGSYADIFAQMRSARPAQTQVPRQDRPRQNSLHTRARSTGSAAGDTLEPPPAQTGRRGSHTRSISLPGAGAGAGAGADGAGEVVSPDMTPRVMRDRDASQAAVGAGLVSPGSPGAMSRVEEWEAAQAAQWSPVHVNTVMPTPPVPQMAERPFLPAINTDQVFGSSTFLSPGELMGLGVDAGAGAAGDTRRRSRLSVSGDRRSSGGGWWDIVSAVGSDSRSPFRSSFGSPDRGSGVDAGGGGAGSASGSRSGSRMPWRRSFGASPEKVLEAERERYDTLAYAHEQAQAPVSAAPVWSPPQSPTKMPGYPALPPGAAPPSPVYSYDLGHGLGQSPDRRQEYGQGPGMGMGMGMGMNSFASMSMSLDREALDSPARATGLGASPPAADLLGAASPDRWRDGAGAGAGVDAGAAGAGRVYSPHSPERGGDRERERDAPPGSESRTRVRPPPIPLVFDRPSFPSPSEKDKEKDKDKDKERGTKSKLATFGRTMSMARRRKDGEGVGKENKRTVSHSNVLVQSGVYAQPGQGGLGGGGGGGGGQGGQGQAQGQGFGQQMFDESVPPPLPVSMPAQTPTPAQRPAQRRAQPSNDPGRWNRDMVASIMGQPAERR